MVTWRFCRGGAFCRREMVLNGLPLVSGGSFVLTVILFVAALAGGCSRSGSVTEDPASIATATNETVFPSHDRSSRGSHISRHAVNADTNRLGDASGSCDVHTDADCHADADIDTDCHAHTNSHVTLFPRRPFFDPNELKQVWNGLPSQAMANTGRNTILVIRTFCGAFSGMPISPTVSRWRDVSTPSHFGISSEQTRYIPEVLSTTSRISGMRLTE